MCGIAGILDNQSKFSPDKISIALNSMLNAIQHRGPDDRGEEKILSKKGEKLIIRDDITLQVARLSKTRLLTKNTPLRLCYYGEVVRKKGTMLRPERQFLQIGAECIGVNSFLADVEMMELAYSSLSLVGINNITIEISSRIFFDTFFNDIKNIALKKERLIKIGDNVSLLFENQKTIQYQIQEMLRIEKIFEAQDVEEELKRRVVHSNLHLVGYKDDTPDTKAKMTHLEEKYRSLNFEALIQ
jgi:histidyl-tRNA synthetase